MYCLLITEKEAQPGVVSHSLAALAAHVLEVSPAAH